MSSISCNNKLTQNEKYIDISYIELVFTEMNLEFIEIS